MLMPSHNYGYPMKLLYQTRAIFSLVFIILNTLILACFLFFFTFFKLILPFKVVRKPVNYILSVIAETWISINSLIIKLFSSVKLTIKNDQALDYKDWYLVTSNHQAWSDILILQMIFNRRIPLLKFFLKQELIKVPVLGLAWWALDFPFMKRYTRAEIEANPSLKGKDIETTRKACEKFKEMPTSVMNFFEGTRFTPAKHDKQQSPFKHLLKPKAGGTAFALSAMQGKLKTLLDITIVYPPNQSLDLISFLGGKIRQVTVIVQSRPIPEWAAQGDYENDDAFRAHFQEWVNSIWQEKDQLLQQYRTD